MLSVEGGAGVGGHTQVVEDQAGVFVELAHFLGGAFYTLGLDQTDGEGRPRGGPDFSGFDAAMVGRVVHDEVGLFSVLEE